MGRERAQGGPTPRFNRPNDRGEFDQRVYDLVRRIPRGRVMTYGDIARWIPCPHSIDPAAYRRIRARWVGYALSRCPDDVPWHRVVNAAGRTSPRPTGTHLLQIRLLEAEGALLDGDDRIDLESGRWQPENAAPPSTPQE